VIELSERHLGTDILAHGHQCDPKDGEGLEGIVLLCFRLLLLAFQLWFGIFRIQVFATLLQHCLHAENITSSGKCTHLNKNLNMFGCLMGNCF